MSRNVKVIVLGLFLGSCGGDGMLSLDLEDDNYSERTSFKEEEALYGYDGGRGTGNWIGACASGSKQSPIDIKYEETVSIYESVLRFSGDQQITQSTNITNTGHSVRVELRTHKTITATGGVFGNKVYEFQQLHFHWGTTIYEGSEHIINSIRSPLEGHLVFHKANCKDLKTEPDGIAVLGVQYDLFPKDNQGLDSIIKTVGQITNPREFIVRPNGVPLRDYLPADLNTYFSYTGSLTTPPCTEGVTWIVFTNRQTVSERQVSQLRTIKDNQGLAVQYNFRETQPIHERQVYLVQSFEPAVA